MMEQEAMLRLMLRERARLLAYIWTIVHDEHLAEDLFQEVSVTVLQGRMVVRDEEHLSKLLRRIARFKAIDVLRQRNLAPVSLDEATIDLLEARWREQDGIDGTELMDALRGCVARLSPYAQELVRLRYAEGLTGQPLAERLNRRVESVYVALSRVHHALQECVRRRQTHTQEASS